MKASGCYKLTFGLETGSQKTLKFIRKTQQDLQEAKRIIEYCNKIGIWTHSPFIIGFPYEERADMEETMRYAEETDLDMAAFFIATPFPGTDLYKIYKSEGLLPKFEDPTQLEWTGSQQYVMCNTMRFTKEELRELVALAMKRFYKSRILKRLLKPGHLFSKCRSWDEIRYLFKLFKMSLQMFRHFSYSEMVFEEEPKAPVPHLQDA